jgi:hypothetical protein
MVRRSVSVAVGVAVLLCVAVVAQPVLAAVAERPQGQAIQFGIGQFLNLKEFGGATIAYQRCLSRNVAWRLGVTVDLNYSASDYSETGTGDADMDASAHLKVWNHQVAVSCEWLVLRGSPVSLYFGGGPRFSYSTSQDEHVDFALGDEESWHTDRSDVSGLSAGAVGVLGVQWAPSDWCALHAEYRVNASYVRRVVETWRVVSGDTDYTHDQDETWNGFALDSEGVRAGLSIYF